MSRRYSTVSHPGILMPIIVFGILALVVIAVLLGWYL